MSIFDSMFQEEQKNYKSISLDDKVILSLDLPGVKKEDAKIEIKNNMLTISWKRNSEYFGNKENSQSFSITSLIDVSNAVATLENGELIIEIPKKKKDVKILQIE